MKWVWCCSTDTGNEVSSCVGSVVERGVVCILAYMYHKKQKTCTQIIVYLLTCEGYKNYIARFTVASCIAYNTKYDNLHKNNIILSTPTYFNMSIANQQSLNFDKSYQNTSNKSNNCKSKSYKVSSVI